MAEGRDRVLSCVRDAARRGEPFPTARRLRELTGLSLSTVHKHIHQLSEDGLITLPGRYPERTVCRPRRVLAVQRKRLVLAGGESMTLSLIIAQETDGNVSTDIVSLETSSVCPPVRRILSCQDLSPEYPKRG